MKRAMTMAIGAAGLAAGLGSAAASSHREAPGISQDPTADSTDLYLFRSPTEDGGAADTVTIIANYWPMEDPGGGPNFARFSDEVVYYIRIDNDGDAKEDIYYQIYFKTRYLDEKSFLYNKGPISSPTDPNLLVQQTATITRTDKKGKTTQTDVVVAPNFVGAASYPATKDKTSDQVYEEVAKKGVTALTTRGGGKIFLGPRDDPFYVDLGFIFDLLQIRGGAPGGTGKGGGVDYLAGYNVHSIALQLPIEAVTSDGSKAPAHGKGSVIGVWTTAHRAKTTTIGKGGKKKLSGWVQISRLGLPLVNEVLVPIGIKDFFATTEPKNDAKNAAGLLQDPELAKLLRAIYELDVPGAGRTDLISLISFNLGIAPLDVAGLQPADILRLDLSVAASSVNPSKRLGLLAGDAAGYPNGRRLADDVTDISLRAVAGVLCTKGKTCDIEANTTPLGDAVDQNDKVFVPYFPYAAPPHGGSEGKAIHAKPAGRQ